ncbi:phosphoribosylamine--glycine ligase [Scrofimicrobium sp. R131]|uniref:Phosphoribosylamine--glycine ligase n=1 Tax=Scrofimicrobium appendicitidis TaxID=3079930 RepID=A0AAU7V6D7_9ACTO
MDVMVVGGGGREHALVRALKNSPKVTKIYALPGNGGIASLAECVPIGATDLPAIVDFATSHQIDFAVVAPDDPLVLGAVDLLEAAGIPSFGPTAAAAQIEGSKTFAKELMRRHHIPTAAYQVFTDQDAAFSYLADVTYPIVVKADGLALGKGVIIAESESQAREAVHSMLSGEAFGDSGRQVVIEEFLTGPEVTVLAFTDGHTVKPMVASMDHKRIFDGDRGPNTGGMGVIAPNPFYTSEVAQYCAEHIFQPTVAALSAEGNPFRGCLYFGLMLTPDGPKVIEYNCRFGDPETQAILPLLRSDLLTIMQAVHDQRLDEVEVDFADQASCCVVLASEGYPGQAQVGRPITIDSVEDGYTHVYHAGTKLDEGQLVTSGGRVLAVTATADTLPQAVERAYQALDHISFEGAQFRRDIGAAALRKVDHP